MSSYVIPLFPAAAASPLPTRDAVAAELSRLRDRVDAGFPGKADKVPSAVSGNLASLDASGNLADSGATPASIKAAAVAEVVANAPGTMDTLKEIADILGSSQQSGTVLRRISDLESGKADVLSLAAVATSGSYSDLQDKPTIPAAVLFDRGLTTPGAAADAKAVGDALRSGYTEWVVVRTPTGYPTLISCEWNDGMDAWGVEFSDGGVDRVSNFVSASKDATVISTTDFELRRHLITPTKTSQLTNDGDGTSAFAKVSQLPGAYTGTPAADGVGSSGSSGAFARGDHVHPTDSTRAPLESPAFTGTPTALTAPAGTNTTQIATTAFVVGEMSYDFIVAVQNGDWQFSGDGVQSGHTYTVTETEMEGYWSYSLKDNGSEISVANIGDPVQVVTFSEQGDPSVDIIANRAYTLHNRANNKVILADDSGTSYLQLPAGTAGKMRDLLVRVELETGYIAATDPNNEFKFVAPSGETITFESKGGEMPYPEEDGAYWFSLSESDQTVVGGVVTASKFAVAMEKMAEVS